MATTHLSRCSHNHNNNEINLYGVGSHTHTHTHILVKERLQATNIKRIKTGENLMNWKLMPTLANTMSQDNGMISRTTPIHNLLHIHELWAGYNSHAFFYFRESGKYSVTIACSTQWKPSKRTTSAVIELQRWQTRHETVIREKSKTKRLHSPFTGSNNAWTGKSNTRTQHPNWITFENLLYFVALWSFVISF